ncbi:hypothetical protein JCM10213_003692 [Rhodosporidiobolus nylandii]
MPSASPRPPPSLEQLRTRGNSALADFRPHEYSIRTWVNHARVAFDKADRDWRDGRHTGDPQKVEDAYLEFKKAAGCMEKVIKHPGYADLARIKPPEYLAWQDLQRAAREAGEASQAAAVWLQKREAEWARQHGQPGAGGSGGGMKGPKVVEAGRLVANERSSAPPSRPEPVKTPSFPTTSLADRMAALRAQGLQGAGQASGTTHPTTTPSAASSAHLSSPKRTSVGSLPPSSPKRSASPSLPSMSPKSNGHATLRSPPASPRATKRGDLVADNAGERSGSAPPVLPYSHVQDAATAGREGALQFRREGGTPIAEPEDGVLDRGPAGGVALAPEGRGPHSELTDLPSPSKFMANFPSLDDFEKQTNSTSSSIASLPSLPSVPTTLPSSAASAKPRLPPPHPPKPKHLDSPTFEREQRERADALAKRAAGHANSDPSAATPLPLRAAGLPVALVPGGHKPAPAAPSSTSPLPPPTASSSAFPIPFSTEVRPAELFQYLQTARAEKGQGPRVLLLDVRSRDEYERARIRGETVCLEPISLRDGIRSSDIEDSLSLAPAHEAALFNARQHYDMVVIYDRSSASLPQGPPVSSSSEAQRVLYNLMGAIYEREFYKCLRRQPVLLRGGWEAWVKEVGRPGVVGTAVAAVPEAGEAARPRAGQSDMGMTDAKRAHRRAAIMPSVGEGGRAVLRNGGEMNAGTDAGRAAASSAGYFSPSSSYSSGALPSGSNGVISPRLAMPPAVAQRSGPAPAYDPFATSPHAARPAYHQPQLDGYSLPTSPPSSSPSIPRTRSDVPDLYHASQSMPSTYGNSDYTRSSFDYSRPSIDYPTLQHRAAPPVSQQTRPPPPPSHGSIHPAPLARPPPAKPAPIRSNSSFSSLQLSQYSPAQSRFPSSMSFDEGVIGLTGLKNLGNTCYMNSTIQCLSAAIPFAKYFTSGAYRKDINTVNPLGTKGALANAVAELIRALWAQQYNFLSPVTFREQICRVASQFRGSEQHDAQEFLGFLLDGLHEDCNYVVRKPPPIEMTPEREHDLETLPAQLMSEREWQIYKMRNDSFIVQCFQGQFRNQLRCLTCQKTSTTYNTFMPLSVPIPGGRGVGRVSLMACLETFVRDEVLDKDDAWHCPRCKKNRKAVKKLSLSKLPPILVIHLKRFSFAGPFSDKIETQVQYPLAGLDLTPFLPPPLMSAKDGQQIGRIPPQGYTYDLFGVTNHYGNLSSGHYTAFVRNGREWFNIGDSKVTPCEPAVVQSAKSAYILYYAMRT